MENLFQRIRTLNTGKRLVWINILGLSICIAAALLILLYVRFELSFDNFHDGERVFRVESRLYEGTALTDNWATTTFGHASAMSREIPGIEAYVRLTAQDREQVVKYKDRQFSEDRYCYTEPSFFELFRFPILRGKMADQLVRPHTLVLTESAAGRYFGDTDPLGKILTFRTATGEQNFEVTGVIADMAYHSHFRYDFLLAYSSIPKARQDIWYIHGVYTYLRLKPGVDPASVETAFFSLSDKYRTEALRHKKWSVELIPLGKIHLTPQKPYEKETKGSRTAIGILLVMAVALLLIGWVNALNLNVARYLERGKEFGIRKAFGISRRQILLQGIREAGAINLLATVIALGWLEVFLPVVHARAGLNFGQDIWTEPFVWILALGVAGIGTLCTGLYPSSLLLRICPSEIMRGKPLHSTKGNRMRRLVIVVQFFASFVLLAGTFIVVAQVRYMQNESRSVVDQPVLVVKYPSFTAGMSVKMDSFKKQLQEKAYVRRVTISGAVPGMEVANYFANRPYGSDPSQVKLIQMLAVDPDYLSTYSQNVICGRDFSEAYGNELDHVILNEEAVGLLGYASNEEALGKQLTMEILPAPIRIIGVVRNFYQQSLATPYKPILFFMKERIPIIGTPYISIRLDAADAASRLEEIEQIYEDFFPDSLFSYYFLDDYNNRQYRADRNFGWMFACSSLLSVFVACLGLWVVTLFSTLSRMKEIGIRKVLGAGKLSLFQELTRELVLLMLVAFSIGTPVSVFLMNRWLNGYAFHIALPLWVYPVTFVLLMSVAFLTLYQQVWKIIRLNPMRILKSE